MYTRKALTGAMMMLAFVATWLPSSCDNNWANALEWIKNNDSTAITGLVAAVLGSPFIGFIIGTSVQGVWYLFWGQPYKKVTRKFKQELLEAMAQRGESKVRDHITKMGPLHLFCFFFYSFAPKELVDWSRRRRTAEVLAYNWSPAIIFGILLGLRFGGWDNVKLPFILLLCLILFLTWVVSCKAKKEANEAERLWCKRFIEGGLVENLVPYPEKPKDPCAPQKFSGGEKEVT